MDTIKCFGLSENQVSHAVGMYADDELDGRLYSLHEVLPNENIRENIIAVDDNVLCDEKFLDDMVKFVTSLDEDRDWNVYIMVDSWSPRELIQIEGIIAFS